MKENGWVAGQGQLRGGDGHSSDAATCLAHAHRLVQLRSHRVWGPFLVGLPPPLHSPSKHLFVPCYLDKGNHTSHINTLLGARC